VSAWAHPTCASFAESSCGRLPHQQRLGSIPCNPANLQTSTKYRLWRLCYGAVSLHVMIHANCTRPSSTRRARGMPMSKVLRDYFVSKLDLNVAQHFRFSLPHTLFHSPVFAETRPGSPHRMAGLLGKKIPVRLEREIDTSHENAETQLQQMPQTSNCM